MSNTFFQHSTIMSSIMYATLHSKWRQGGLQFILPVPSANMSHIGLEMRSRNTRCMDYGCSIDLRMSSENVDFVVYR